MYDESSPLIAKIKCIIVTNVKVVSDMLGERCCCTFSVFFGGFYENLYHLFVFLMDPENLRNLL